MFPVEIMAPLATPPDEIETRAGAGPAAAEAAPAPPAERELPAEAPITAPEAPAEAPASEADDAVVLPEEPPQPEENVQKSKVGTKRLKKAAKEVQKLGVDVDVGEEK